MLHRVPILEEAALLAVGVHIYTREVYGNGSPGPKSALNDWGLGINYLPPLSPSYSYHRDKNIITSCCHSF